MKKLSLLFVVFVVFIAANAQAQQKNESSNVINDEYLNSIVIKKEAPASLGSAQPTKVNTISNNKAKESVKNAEISENKSIKVSKSGELKIADPYVRATVYGNPAMITNQPLQRYNEDLTSVKVQ